eukprot:COSAG01_NODE_4173_length_5269_cov_7.276015_5_plen_190_part_00
MRFSELPFGYICSTTQDQSIPDLVQGYLDDSNKLKCLKLEKEVSFNFGALKQMVCGYIRSLGWWRGLCVTFPKANHITRVWTHNWLSDMWENCGCRVCCYLTIIPALVMCCYRDCGCHQEKGVRSIFQIQYQHTQVFEMIRSQIWIPAYVGQQLAMRQLERMGAAFWGGMEKGKKGKGKKKKKNKGYRP